MEKKKKKMEKEDKKWGNGSFDWLHRNFIIIVCDSRFSFNCQKLYTTGINQERYVDCARGYTNVRDNWKLIIGISRNKYRGRYFYTLFFSLKFSNVLGKIS